MGCGASTAAPPPVLGAGEEYVDLKDVGPLPRYTSTAYSSSIPSSRSAAPKVSEPWDSHMEAFRNLTGALRIEREDGTEQSMVPPPSSGISRDQADLQAAGQQLALFVAATGFGREKAGVVDRHVTSVGGHFELSRAQLSVHAALNQTGALKALLSTPSQDPNRRDPDGERCPLHWAAARGHIKCAVALLNAGARPSEIEKMSGLTCAELAQHRGHHRLAELLRKAAAGGQMPIVPPPCRTTRLASQEESAFELAARQGVA